MSVWQRTLKADYTWFQKPPPSTPTEQEQQIPHTAIVQGNSIHSLGFTVVCRLMPPRPHWEACSLLFSRRDIVCLCIHWAVQNTKQHPILIHWLFGRGMPIIFVVAANMFLFFFQPFVTCLQSNPSSDLHFFPRQHLFNTLSYSKSLGLKTLALLSFSSAASPLLSFLLWTQGLWNTRSTLHEGGTV